MKLNELKSGMVCKLRNGKLYFVMKDTSFGDVLVNIDTVEKHTSLKKSAIKLNRYRDKLCCQGCASRNIDEVYAPVGQMCLLRNWSGHNAKNLYQCVWKRNASIAQKEEVHKMTMDELKALLGHDVIIVE